MPHAFEGNWHPPGVVANGSFLWAAPVFLPAVGGTGNSFPIMKKKEWKGLPANRQLTHSTLSGRPRGDSNLRPTA